MKVITVNYRSDEFVKVALQENLIFRRFVCLNCVGQWVAAMRPQDPTDDAVCLKCFHRKTIHYDMTKSEIEMFAQGEVR